MASQEKSLALGADKAALVTEVTACCILCSWCVANLGSLTFYVISCWNLLHVEVFTTSSLTQKLCGLRGHKFKT